MASSLQWRSTPRVAQRFECQTGCQKGYAMRQEHSLPSQANSDAMPGFMGLFGEHASMRRVFEVIRRVGPSDAPVLITGESGTGKELVARALHALSNRTTRNFVPVHC